MSEQANSSELDKKLTDKESRFVEEYCIDFNATRAAREAGYSEKGARQIGHATLTKVYIRRAIDKRLDELSMTAAEATKRLTDWGRGTFAPFLRLSEDGNVILNLGTLEAKENIHLIKKVKQTKIITRIEEMETEEVRTEVELHDAKDAVIQIAKIRQLLVQKVDHTTNGKDLPNPTVVLYLPDNGRETTD